MCQCEHKKHGEPYGETCSGHATQVVQTIYGRFNVCPECTHCMELASERFHELSCLQDATCQCVEPERVYDPENRYHCHHCKSGNEADEQYSFGCYAGRYCDECWRNSGYRDAADPCARFDPADAGESLEEI